jgi:hypothetical protein
MTRANLGPGDGDSFLSLPRARQETEQRAEEEQDRAARRLVARWTMLRAHGCTGASCRHEFHGRDAEARDLVLSILGLEVAA